MSHILIIADDEGLEGFVRRMVDTSHAVSRVEWTGAAAAKIAAGERFNAILRDVPSSRSFESLEWIDTRHAFKVVLLLQGSTIVLGAFHGVTVRAPFSVEQLRGAIETALEREWGP